MILRAPFCLGWPPSPAIGWVDRLRQTYRTAAETLHDHDVAEESHEDVVGARISIDRLLDLLPAPQSDVIRIVKIEGHSIADACQHTGQSESLVKVNIHRA